MIDSLLLQINERFNNKNVELMAELSIFIHENLMKENCNTRAPLFCQNYNIDIDMLQTELQAFKDIYKIMEKEIYISDLIPEKNHQKEENGEEDGTSDIDDIQDKNCEDLRKFLIRGFIKPFRLLCQLSTFNNLTVAYKILLQLPMTSCSAERAFSKEKIVKNPLRSVMKDKWLSSMMILACESDVLDTISNEDIIQKFATSSTVYSKMLLKK